MIGALTAVQMTPNEFVGVMILVLGVTLAMVSLIMAAENDENGVYERADSHYVDESNIPQEGREGPQNGRGGTR